MELSRKEKIGALVGLAVIVCAFYSYRQNKAASRYQLKNLDLKYESLVTGEDRKPLPPPKGQSVKIPILMYHHIGEPPPNAGQVRKDLTVSVQNFTDQVKWLRDNGYSAIHLMDIYNYSKGKFTLPKKPVVFTFDDGYDDVFQNAIPILRQYGYTGSFAIITQYPHQQQGDNFYASWDEIASAYSAGNEVVCHTQNHFDGSNPNYSADFIFSNLSGCQQDIKNHLGSAEPVLVYPYGHYNANYLAQANKAGFVMGVTVHEGDILDLANLMAIPRVRVHAYTTADMLKRLLEK